MKAIWAGAVRFGLIYIPVKMYKASINKDLPLHLVRREDHCRIRNRRVCESTGEEVALEEIAHAFEFEKDRYVTLEQEDFQRANVRKTSLIDILNFTDAGEIDPKYMMVPFYLEPDKDSDKPYALLREAMRHSGKAALVRYVMRTREHLGLLRPEGNALLLVQMRYASDVLSPDELNLPSKGLVSQRELRMADKLVDLLTETWNPRRYHNTYVEDLQRFIQRKVEGKAPLSAESPLDMEMKDLFTSLSQSLEQAQEQAKDKNPSG
jgi:DNA end-binding protein Ku